MFRYTICVKKSRRMIALGVCFALTLASAPPAVDRAWAVNTPVPKGNNLVAGKSAAVRTVTTAASDASSPAGNFSLGTGVDAKGLAVERPPEFLLDEKPPVELAPTATATELTTNDAGLSLPEPTLITATFPTDSSPAPNPVMSGLTDAATHIADSANNDPGKIPFFLNGVYVGPVSKTASEDEPPLADIIDALFKQANKGSVLLTASGQPVSADPAQPAGKPPSPVGTMLSVASFAALVDIATLSFAVTVMHLADYRPHSNYHGPMESFEASPSLGAALALVAGTSILAPIAEEVVFRGILFGGISKALQRAFGKDSSAAFWLPALATSVGFALIHETANPVLITTRTIGGMMLAWAFHYFGLWAAIVSHGLYNGIRIIIILTVLGVESGSPFSLLGIAALSVIIAAGMSFGIDLKTREGRQAAIRSAPTLGLKSAFAMALILTAGLFLASFSAYGIALSSAALAGLLAFMAFEAWKIWSARRSTAEISGL